MAAVEAPRRRRFPADIEAEILLRLPVKTLIRFKIVCKPWSFLISSPQFQKSHHRHTQHNPPLLLTLHSEENLDIGSDSGDKTLRYNNYIGPEAGSVFHVTNFSKFIQSEFYNRDMLTLRFSTFNTTPLTLVNNFSKTLPQPQFDNSMAGKPFMQSCMGLVCIASWSWTIPPILVINPSTRARGRRRISKTKSVPSSTLRTKSHLAPVVGRCGWGVDSKLVGRRGRRGCSRAVGDTKPDDGGAGYARRAVPRATDDGRLAEPAARIRPPEFGDAEVVSSSRLAAALRVPMKSSWGTDLNSGRMVREAEQ